MNVLVLGSNRYCESILCGLSAIPAHHVERISDARVESAPVDVADFDALVCAGTLRPLLNQIRLFLVAGKPVMVIPTAALGSDVAYELLALDEESGGRLIAGFPHRYDRVWRGFRERVCREAADGLQLLQIERQMKRPVGTGVLSHAEVGEILLTDADLLRWLGSESTQVTCLYTGSTEAGVSRVTVTLSGDAPPEATWVLNTDVASERCQVTVTTANDSFSVSGPGIVADSTQARECAAGLLGDLERVCAGQPPQAAWMDAVRAFDVMDAARRSVRRRRTVEIAAGEVSERGQFKTKMTALGCSLLSFTLFGVIAALLIGAVFDPRDAMQRRSEAAGFVLESDAFEPGTAQLTPESQDRLTGILARLRETPAEIIVESSSTETKSTLDEERRAELVSFLRETREVDLDSRVVVRPLAGRWFQRFMTALWIVVFLPLGVFLALQLLILVTRSPEGPAEP